jgi:hypothetical protein
MSFRRKDLWIVLAVLLGALAVRLVNCRRGILADEIATWWVTCLPESRIVEERLAHNHLPTYFLLMRQWLKLVGASELTLRLPSILSGAGAVAALFLICRRRFSLDVALLASAFYGLNATHLFVSQWTRMYALTAFLEVLFFGFLLSDLRRPSAKRFARYAAAVIAGSCLHLLFLQMAAIACGLLIWDHWHGTKSRRTPEPSNAPQPPALAPLPAQLDARRSLAASILRYLSPFALGVVLLLVWVNHAQTLSPRSVKATDQLAWLDGQMAPIPIRGADTKPAQGHAADPSRVMLRVAFGDFSYWPFLRSGWPKYLARAVLYALAALLLWAAFRAPPIKAAAVEDAGRRLDEWRALRFAVLWAVLPPLLMTVGAMLLPWVSSPAPRWLVGTAAPWALLFAVGIARLPGRSCQRRWAAIALLSVAVFVAWGWLRIPGDGLEEAFGYWQAHARPEDKVFLAHRGYLEQAMRFKGMTLPRESLRSGTVLDHYTGQEAARKLVDFAADDSPIWVLHYRYPPVMVLQEAFATLSPSWRTERVYECGACSVYRLSRSVKD